MPVETVIYKVEAKVRVGRGKPITCVREVENITLEEAKVLARAMLAELLGHNPGLVVRRNRHFVQQIYYGLTQRARGILPLPDFFHWGSAEKKISTP